MKTLSEINKGYLSTFERMATMLVASRLDAAAYCEDDAEAANSKEFCDCVHCIVCSYVFSGSLTAVEIPCDVSILDWVNAMHYVINWFNDCNVPYDDDDPDDETTEDMMYEDGSSYFTTKDMELEQLKACIGEYVPHPYSDAYLEMVSSGDYVLDDEYDYGACYIETTEDMMYPDCSSHFTTKDMEAEHVSCKDCPDDE